ncbi:hypothetical protein CIW51_03260 [Mycolicibacterium sp. P9-22]|nr:hypothetical protein CIW51_03260 [Mycolicibacterium sp. P9-22]
MTKFRYGPWDDQYYPVIGALVGRGLIRYAPGKRGSVALALTKQGAELVKRLKSDSLWSPVAGRYEAIAGRFGLLTGNRLKDAIYAALPEKMNVGLRTEIK